MMDQDEQRALIMEFERSRQLLGSIASQKQQISIQIEVMKASLEELEKTKEKSVYKAVGNVLIPKNTEEMKKEIKEKSESMDLRLKTVEKQEESILKKLNSLKTKIEGTEGKGSESSAPEEESKKEKKSRK